MTWRVVLFAAFVTFIAWAATAETGPEPVDFFCNSVAAARGAADDMTLVALVEQGKCGSFVTDYGFQAYGELTFVEEIEGTDFTIWLVDFANTITVYTVR